MDERMLYDTIGLIDLTEGTFTVIHSDQTAQSQKYPSSWETFYQTLILPCLMPQQKRNMESFLSDEASSLSCELNGIIAKITLVKISPTLITAYILTNHFKDPDYQSVENKMQELGDEHINLVHSVKHHDFYTKAILADSLGILEYNATTDELFSIDYDERDQDKSDFMNAINVSLPCKASWFFKMWAEKMVDHDQAAFLEHNSYDNIKALLDQGYYTARYDFVSHNSRLEKCYIHETNVITVAESGQIMVVVILKDNTNRTVEKIQNDINLEIVKALSSNYESIIFVDRYDHFQVYRSSERMKRKLRDVFHSTRTITEFLRIYSELLVAKGDREYFLKMTDPLYIAQHSQNGTPNLKARYRAINGQNEEYYEIKMVNIGTHNHPMFVYATGNVDEDMRETLRYQQALQDALIAAQNADRAKHRFLLDMSHDLRTPLNAIIGFSQIAKNHLHEPEQLDEYFNNILTSANHLLAMVNDVLIRNRIETGRMEFKEVPVSLNQVLKDLIVIVQNDAVKNNIQLQVTKKNIIHDSVFLDPMRVVQIFQNVLGNAIKYGKEGGIVRFEVEELGVDNDYAQFSFLVIDDGIGISEEFIHRIYEPFSREKNTTKSGVMGTGLGMAITRSIVNMMGGTIKISSLQGVGTTVTIMLEFKIDQKYQERIKESKVDTPRDFSCLKGKKILLVEDNALNAEMMTLIIEEAGLKVRHAYNGRIAVDIMSEAADDEYDWILMDIQMPVMNGLKATTAIRALPGRKAQIPIIALSADAFEHNKQEAYARSMNSYITKPFEINDLLGILVELMEPHKEL